MIHHLQSLELRRLLDATLQDGLLLVSGTDRDDEIRLRIRDGELIVDINARGGGGDDDDEEETGEFRFKAGNVQQIVINGRDGDDEVIPGLELPAMEINGGSGADILLGGNDSDTLSGGNGNDYLDGKGGADQYFGGNGFDSADYRFYTERLEVSLDNNPNDGPAGEGDNVRDDVERIVGGENSDLLIGSAADNSITGQEGNDTILGLDGNDSIDGDDGIDSLVGGDGNDRLTGHDGEDVMEGNGGDDVFLSADAFRDEVRGGPGDDFAETRDDRDAFESVENVPGEVKVPDITVLQGGDLLTDGQAEIDFGTVKLDANPVDVTFNVRNDGNETLSISDINVPAGFRVIDGLAANLAPGKADTFTVRMLTGSAGSKTGQITVQSNDGDEDPFNIGVSGLVEQDDPAPILRPEITVTVGGNDVADGDTVVNFGAVQAGENGPERTFTVTNEGKGVLDLGKLQLPGFLAVVEGLDGVLAPGASDQFTVRLATGTAGTFNGQVRFDTNDTNENPFNILVRGIVRDAPPPPPGEVTVVFDGTTVVDGKGTISFGSIEQGKKAPARTVTVRNDGKGTLDLGKLVVPDGFVIVEGLAGPLAPGASDTFTVRMSLGKVGEQSGEVRFNNSDSDEDPFNIAVSGTVRPRRAPEISVNRGKTRLEDGKGRQGFRIVARGGKPRQMKFTVKNEGTAALLVSGVDVPAGYTLVQGLPGKISPGKTGTLTVRLETAEAGTKAGDIRIRTNDSNEGAFRIPVTGIVGVPDIRVTFGSKPITDGSTGAVDFGTLEAGTPSVQRVFTISNQGRTKLKVGKMQMPAGYSLVGKMPKAVKPGQSAAMTLALTSRGGAGTKSGRVVLFSNDPDERPFDFAITGTVKGVGAFVEGNGVLVVEGTAAADAITVSGTGNALSVSGNGASVGTFNNVNRVIVRGGDGNDTINANGIIVPVELDGGGGNDVLTGGKGADTLFGGAGDDRLIGGAGSDSLVGEGGNDFLNAVDGAPDARVDGGAGSNDVRTDPTDPKH